MSLPLSTQSAQSVAELFIALWNKVGGVSSSQRSTSVKPTASFLETLNEILELDAEQKVVNGLIALINGNSSSSSENMGQSLSIMSAIDEVFYRIHPRAVILPTAESPRPKIPKWLRKYRMNRYSYGYYAKIDEQFLLTRGPLLRSCRDEYASNAESLADRFVALVVVEQKLKHESQLVPIKPKFLGTDLAQGVVPGLHHGHETIAFIPIAEEADDLIATEHMISGHKFVDFQINSKVSAAERLINALDKIGFADIAIAPELVMSEIEADKIPEMFLNFKQQPARMTLAGSGPTKKHENGMPWNELRVLNGIGSELWSQRKIWPAGLTKERALEYGLSDPGEGLLMEFNASGEEIIIADADGLGRCIVLICQDTLCNPLSLVLISQFQPDWVFVPILDQGIGEGRWAHQKAFELSGLSNARFLLTSSTALAYKNSLPSSTPYCGLALGPKSKTSDDEGRRVKFVSVDNAVFPGYALLKWREGEWEQSELS